MVIRHGNLALVLQMMVSWALDSYFLLSVCFLLVLSSDDSSCCFFGTAEAAHSRRRVVTRTAASSSAASRSYDRSITTFDPSGRLLQVEYGLSAAQRGSSFLVVAIDGENNNDESAIYVLVSGGAQTPSSSAAMSTNSRCNWSHNKVFRLDDHLWLVTAGLMGDARLLAEALRSHCQRHRLSWGEAPTVAQAARQAAELQHQLTRIGGARPLGCTAMVLGIDDSPTPTTAAGGGGFDGDNEEKLHNNPHGDQQQQQQQRVVGSPRVVRTDPGGILEDCLYYAGGKDGEQLMTAMSAAYDDLIKAAADPHVVASKLTKLMADVCGGGGGGSRQPVVPVDVWVIRPCAGCRGNMQATKFANVQSNMQDERLFASLLSTTSGLP